MHRTTDARALLPACMGGWCTKRDHCAHFHADDRREPAERLCVPGSDGVGLFQPIVIHRPGAAQVLEAA
jgi:hypothetical protein